MGDMDIRLATRDDIPALETLIERSARGVGSQDYSGAQTEAAIAHVYGVDSELIDDGTYYLVTIDGTLAGCGGWSKRRTLFGGDKASARPPEQGQLDPAIDASRIRAFFVDPQFTRRGIARTIAARCEADAASAGFRAMELMATLTGEKLYSSLGYEVIERTSIELPGRVPFPLARMRKSLK
jgi:N-acetylglutamate synthase-like GNAT family acetyltransferase